MGLEQREQSGLVVELPANARHEQREPVVADGHVGYVDRDGHADPDRALVVDHPRHRVVDRQRLVAALERNQVRKIGRAVERGRDLAPPGHECARVAHEADRTPAVRHQRGGGRRGVPARVEVGVHPLAALRHGGPRLARHPDRTPGRQLADQVVARGVGLPVEPPLPVGDAECHLPFGQQRSVVVELELVGIDADLQVVTEEARLDAHWKQQQRRRADLEALGVIEQAEQREVALELVDAQLERLRVGYERLKRHPPPPPVRASGLRARACAPGAGG